MALWHCQELKEYGISQQLPESAVGKDSSRMLAIAVWSHFKRHVAIRRDSGMRGGIKSCCGKPSQINADLRASSFAKWDTSLNSECFRGKPRRMHKSWRFSHKLGEFCELSLFLTRNNNPEFRKTSLSRELAYNSVISWYGLLGRLWIELMLGVRLVVTAARKGPLWLVRALTCTGRASFMCDLTKLATTISGQQERWEPLFAHWKSLVSDAQRRSANRGLPLPLGRGVCETKSKNGRARPRKPFISRVFCAQRGSETMVSDHGLGRGQTMG